MSHVDEGALHAYLDGALDAAYGTSEAARIREHMESCGTCAERLEEERVLQSAAASILASADPPLDDLPTLEEMRAQAAHRTSGAGAAGGRMWKMAWAASIMVALGTGWMANRITVPDQAGSIREEILPPGPGEPDLEFQDVVGRADAQAGERAVGEPAAAEANAPSPDAEASVPSVPLDRAASDLDTRGAGSNAPAPSATSPAEARDVELDAMGLQGIPESVAKMTEDEVPEEQGRRRQVARAELPAEGRLEQAPAAAFSALSAQDVREASVVDEVPVGVPGLEIVTVTLLGGDGVAGGIRVVQILEGGESLEILQLPGDMDPSVLTPLTEGYSEWIAPRPNGWLVLRARVGADSLASLGRSITEGR